MPTLNEIAAASKAPRIGMLEGMAQGRGGDLRAWQPGIMDNVRNYAMNALAPLFGGDVRAANAYYRDKIQPTAEYLPGVGDLMAAGEAKDAFSAGDYLGGGLLAVGAAAGLVPGVGDVAQKGIKKGIRAYHGSPHDFDKFSMEKIGTGEGAQAYGHGLYFAEAEDVAKGYRDRLSTFDPYGARRPNVATVDGVPARDLGQDVWDVSDQISSKGFADVDEYIADIKRRIQETGNPSRADVFNDLLAQAESVAPQLRGKTIKFDQGRMYEVNINANPDDFLDWDKPLSEQPESVRSAMRSTLGASRVEMPDGIVQLPSGRWALTSAGEVVGRPQGWPDEATARQALKYVREDDAKYLYGNVGAILQREKQQPAISEKLRQAGIPGIKYLDAGSRSAGDGSRNYVVFDDSLIEILRKYGVLPAAIGTGAFMQMMQDDPQKAQDLHNFATSVRDGA